MPTKQIKVGDRIRLKVRTMSGWKGTGTVIFSDPYGGIIEFEEARMLIMGADTAGLRRIITAVDEAIV